MKNYCLKNLFIGLLLTASTVCWSELRATVDRDNLAINESLQLVVRFSGQAISGEPDFRPIKKDFDIVSTSRQQQYSVINGNSESYTDWKMILLPKRSGQLLIPSLNFKGNTSSAVTINVRPASSGKDATNGTNNQPVYTETEVDKQTAYIQEQIILTVRLVTSVQLQDFSYSELEIPNVLTQKVAETQFQKVINGRNHLVVEIKFALFPQQEGKLDIPTLRMGAYKVSNYSQFGGLPSRGKRLLRLTEEKTIDILPKPAQIPNNQWMPTSNLKINENWSDTSGNLKVGEPVTRTITITTQGLTAAQILPLPEQQHNDYKLYPDQPRLEDAVGPRGVVGQRTETLAIVPNKTGALVMPPIEIKWWDTVNKQVQTSTLPSRTFNVLVADPIQSTIKDPSENSGLQLDSLDSNKNPAMPTETQQFSALTRWSMTLNVLLIIALVSLLYLRRSTSTYEAPDQTNPLPSASNNLRQQLKLIEKQASANQLRAMRDSILKWGINLFPEQTPKTLQELGVLMASEPLIEQFALLDQHLFKADTNAETFDARDLITQLKEYKRPATDKHGQNSLKPLYPERK
jgi:hypothetical protein